VPRRLTRLRLNVVAYRSATITLIRGDAEQVVAGLPRDDLLEKNCP
jgi:hypothetical protein